MNSQDSLFSSSSSVKTEAFSSPSLTEQKQKVSLFYSFITRACEVKKKTSLKIFSSEEPTFLTIFFFTQAPSFGFMFEIKKESIYIYIRLVIGKKDMKQKSILKHL